MSDNMTDILMVTFNRLEFTKKALASIFERTLSPYRLIVVDNNSTDGTREWLAKQEHIDELLLLRENVGLERARMKVMPLINSRYFVTTDNDCLAPLLDPDWLSQMIWLMQKNVDYGAIAMRTQVMVGVGEIFKDKTDDVVEFTVAGGSFRIMDLDRVKEVGGWSNQFVNMGRGNEEWDISGKLRARGYKVGYTRNIFSYHMFGKKNWGYPDEIDAAAARSIKEAPQDEAFDPITNEPKVHHNE